MTVEIDDLNAGADAVVVVVSGGGVVLVEGGTVVVAAGREVVVVAIDVVVIGGRGIRCVVGDSGEELVGVELEGGRCRSRGHTPRPAPPTGMHAVRVGSSGHVFQCVTSV